MNLTERLLRTFNRVVSMRKDIDIVYYSFEQDSTLGLKIKDNEPFIANVLFKEIEF